MYGMDTAYTFRSVFANQSYSQKVNKKLKKKVKSKVNKRRFTCCLIHRDELFKQNMLNETIDR